MLVVVQHSAVSITYIFYQSCGVNCLSRYSSPISQDSWIGLEGTDPVCACAAGGQNCNECHKQWTWLDGAAMLDANGELVFDRWHSNAPSSPNTCARLTSNGFWRGRGCAHNVRYVCKRGNLVFNTNMYDCFILRCSWV